MVLCWNMEQRGRSADTVSCQPLSALASLRESPSKSSTVYWSTRNNYKKIIRILPRSIVYGCSLALLQVGTRQSNLSVSNPPNRSAFTQRYLLCNHRTPAHLHGHPQADRHPIYESTKTRVSLPFYYDAQTAFYTTAVVENYNSTYTLRVLRETRHLLCVFICFSESWSCKGRAQPQTLPRRSKKQSLL